MNHLRVTIREVAAKAGVSHQTVSRVINESERVSPDTRQRVQAAIAELGYQPNAIARSMARGSTRTLACIAPNLTDYTYASIIDGAETEARRHGYFLISVSARDPADFNVLVEQLIASQRTEGLLALNPYIDDRSQHLPAGVPTVIVGARARDERSHSVSLDEANAGRMATQYLISMGHRRIAHLTGPLEEDCSQDRQAGYQQALEAAGIAFDPTLVMEGDWSATSGHHAVECLLEDGADFTAIFAQNDRIAVGAIRALREAGLQVPGQVSVVGFDDMPLASYFDPPLTTLRQDIFCIGCEAARLLIQAIQQPGRPPQHMRLPVELIVRGSSAKANSEQGGDRNPQFN
jgi:DNA-binding LacI/PurR family transcriptional regulator